jgi:hypothetical protein
MDSGSPSERLVGGKANSCAQMTDTPRERLRVEARGEQETEGGPWWAGRTTGEMLCDPANATSFALAVALHSPPGPVAGPAVAARLVAILRAGELRQPAA